MENMKERKSQEWLLFKETSNGSAKEKIVIRLINANWPYMVPLS